MRSAPESPFLTRKVEVCGGGTPTNFAECSTCTHHPWRLVVVAHLRKGSRRSTVLVARSLCTAWMLALWRSADNVAALPTTLALLLSNTSRRFSPVHASVLPGPSRRTRCIPFFHCVLLTTRPLAISVFQAEKAGPVTLSIFMSFRPLGTTCKDCFHDIRPGKEAM